MKRILITGSSSFTAGYMIPFLQQQEGLRVTGTDKEPAVQDIEFIKADLTSRTETMGLLKKLRPDYIINLAGLNKSEKTYVFFDINLTIARNILESLRALSMQNCKTLLISSSAVYGFIVGSPVQETCSTHPVNAYGFSKLAMEQMALDLFRDFNQQVYLVRPFNLYGPGQQKSFVIPGFIDRLLRIRYAGETKMQTGDLDAERDFLHVSDAVKAYWLVLESGTAGKIYNIGSGHAVKIHDILMKIIDIVGLSRNIDIIRQYGSENQVKTISADITGISQMGWAPEADLDDSLKEIVKNELLNSGYKY